MKKNTPLLLAAAAGILLTASCKKDTEPTRAELLTGGTWRVSFTATDSNENKTLDESEKVDIANTPSMQGSMTFNADGSGSVRTSSSTGDVPMKWWLTNNDEELALEIIGDTASNHVHTLTSSQLVIEIRDESKYRWSGLVR